MGARNLVAIEAEPHGGGQEAIVLELLEEVRAGKISSLAIAKVKRCGSVGGAFSRAPNTALLIGALARMQHHMMKQWDDD